MANLTRASSELFRRTPDETFGSLDSLAAHCKTQRERSTDRWHMPGDIRPLARSGGGLGVSLGQEEFSLNDWSFGQLCTLAGVAKETVNRLSGETASRVLEETLPLGKKPLQAFTDGSVVRSVHGAAYTRLHNDELVTLARESAPDFTPPQKGMTGGTGLYCGEQDLFMFLIDPLGWTEIGDQAFAPGLFLWNSEVGKRTVGVQTFWFQAVCQNHIVWDAVEVVEFSRKHTAKVGEALTEVRSIIEAVVKRRDERRDGFAKAIRASMTQTVGDAEEVIALLARHDIRGRVAKEALEAAKRQGRFTVFSLVDALTRLAGEMKFVGDRTDLDQKASKLLSLSLAA
ncbi:MAG: DUF932 domain-containing protein [Gemmataceae bacterium]